jgi:signal transduction histidine kinase
MKLLTKTTLYYLICSSVVIVIGGLGFYPVLRKIIYNQIDENLRDEKMIITETIDYADNVPDFRPVFGHQIEVTIFNSPRKKREVLRDTNIYFSDQDEFVKYRYLAAENTSVRNKGYIINLYKPLHEADTLILKIYLAVSALIVALLALLVVVNYLIARSAWVPFYKTLSSLGAYNINQEAPLQLSATNISEFISLNKALERMSKKIRKDFMHLKEFNENASHELQTPLAVIKSKIDLLVQDESLTPEQLKLIGAMGDATSRMSKLNQGLLLISRIDNNQFIQEQETDFGTVIRKALDHFNEIITLRGLTVEENITTGFSIRINPVLADILVTNLLSNAIRHNISNGSIRITVSEAGIEMANTGIPLTIDPELLFERFRKTDHRVESAGLGLAVVKKIAGLYLLNVSYLYSDGIHTLRLSKPEGAGFRI